MTDNNFLMVMCSKFVCIIIRFLNGRSYFSAAAVLRIAQNLFIVNSIVYYILAGLFDH